MVQGLGNRSLEAVPKSPMGINHGKRLESIDFETLRAIKARND